LSAIKTTRVLCTGGEIDNEWQIIAECESGGIWFWWGDWTPDQRAAFWSGVSAGRYIATQGRHPNGHEGCFRQYAKLRVKPNAKEQALRKWLHVA
jgi:hypothetical protein